MRSPVLIAAVAACLGTAASAEARSYGLTCEGRPTYIPADTNMPPNTARNTVRFAARLDLRAASYVFSAVEGTGIIPASTVRLLGFDRSGNPIVMWDWRGTDGRARYLGMIFNLSDARFQIAGWTISDGRKIAEYFEGSCRVTE